jgi:serine/threonine protein kinase
MRTRLPTTLSRLRVLRGVAAGLLHLHSKGIVHRDLRCANVLLKSDDTAVIADLGLTRFIPRDAEYVRTKEDSVIPMRWSAPVSATHARAYSGADLRVSTPRVGERRPERT